MTHLFGPTETSLISSVFFFERIQLTLCVKNKPDRANWNENMLRTKILQRSSLTLTIDLFFIDSLLAASILWVKYESENGRKMF